MKLINYICIFTSLLIVSPELLCNNEIIVQKPENKLKTFNLKLEAKRNTITVEHTWQPTETDIELLKSAQIDKSVTILQFPNTYKNINNEEQYNKNLPLQLKRYEIFAPNANIKVIQNGKEQVIAKPNLLVFGSEEVGISLIVNKDNNEVSGLINQHGISMAIEGNLKTGIDFKNVGSSVPIDQSSQQCLTAMADQPGTPFADLNNDLKSNSLVKQINGVINYETIIAVDTDAEWMAGKGNNTSTAMAYIVSLFGNMNVYYEQDLSLRLLIGNTTLRIGSDPYPTRTDAFDSLNDFGEYWRVNNDDIDRDFAILISGQNISDFSFSGIAWINQYCQNGFLQNNGTETVGSYSINRMGSSLPASFSAQFLGHELGHNLGSPHTHCYSPEIDQCFNAESGCYGGAVSCPAGGSGTIMSYCHFGAPNGADCGINNDEFHPTVISLLDTRMVSNFPSCIQPLGSDIIFKDGFE